MEVECVRRIIEHTDWPYKLVVYDNRENTANASKIWNKLLRDSTCEYVMLIDSDALCAAAYALLADAHDVRLSAISDSRWWSRFPTALAASSSSGRPRQAARGYRGTFSGFCFLFRKSVLATVGWFDEEFYFYGADTEWAARFLEAPGQVYLLPDVHVEHIAGHSLSKAERDEGFDGSTRSAGEQALSIV